MRITYLNACGQMGGAETSLLELLGSLRRAQPEWRLHLVLGEDGPLRQKATAIGVSTAVVPFPDELARLGDSGLGAHTISHLVGSVTGTVAYTGHLRRAIRATAPDLIHVTGLKMQLLGVWARPKTAPLLWHIHDYVGLRPLMSRLLRWHEWGCVGAVVNSRSVAQDFERVCPGLPVDVVYNAIDLQRFQPSGEVADLDRMAGLSPAPRSVVRVGLVATYARWKGHLAFLDALEAASRDAALRGYIVGGPIYRTAGSQFSREELELEIRKRNLQETVGLAGFHDNPAAAMRALDIVVHASTKPEPFGMVIAEGMACERAVIASTGGGAAEIAREGENALTHSPGDSGMLARQLVRLARDPELRKWLGREGRRTAEQLCEPGRLAREIAAVYRSRVHRDARN